MSSTTNYCDNVAAVCRGCLATGGEMRNMFEWGLFKDFNIFADVPVSRSEGVSELLCGACEEALRSCRQFRQRCQRSDLRLREAARKAAEIGIEVQPPLRIENSLDEAKLVIAITTPEDQKDTKIYMPCPHNCQKSYIKQKDLLAHLQKSHCVTEQFQIDVRYHCPFPTCSYNKDSEKGKHFDGRKYLNQHLNKAHRNKKELVCETCHLSFGLESEFVRHFNTCNVTFVCALCDIEYKTNERLLVHLKRKHPTLHQQYKEQRKLDRNLKRVSETVTSEPKKPKKDAESLKKDLSEYVFCDSPKRSFATQTLTPEDNIKNDVALPSWAFRGEKSDDIDRNYSTIETQTVFEDLLSLKSQNSEDDSIFFSETVSLSDIQTQTFPLEFGLSRKETITSETQTRNQSPDLSIKETQTCFCLYDSPKLNFRLFDSVNSSPSSINLTSTETQTADFTKSTVKSDVLLSFNSTETQTCFDDGTEKDL